MADPVSPQASRKEDEEKGPPREEPASGHPLRLSTVGIEFGLGIVMLGFLGWVGDGLVGWREIFPVLTVIGVFLGFGWGVWRLQRALNGRKPPRS